MDLERAEKAIAGLEKPPPFAYKNTLRKIATLVTKAAKQAFKNYRSMDGSPWAPLKKEGPNKNKPLYRKKRTKRKGSKIKVINKPVDTLFKMYTKNKFKCNRGGQEKYIRGGEHPRLEIGAYGGLAVIHDQGGSRTIKRRGGTSQTITIPARPVLALTRDIEDKAVDMLLAEKMKMIDKGFY